MRNNKGFSLVELIIVIAIMAILVGVMAPQLIKYIEKTNVSSDTQLCDSVKTAITTAMMDPAVISNSSNGISSLSNADTGAAVSSIDDSTDGTVGKEISIILGMDLSNIDDEIKSTNENGGTGMSVYYKVVNSNSVHVWITASDATGMKDTSSGQLIYVD